MTVSLCSVIGRPNAGGSRELQFQRVERALTCGLEYTQSKLNEMSDILATMSGEGRTGAVTSTDSLTWTTSLPFHSVESSNICVNATLVFQTMRLLRSVNEPCTGAR